MRVEALSLHYKVRCPGCDAAFEDDGLLLGCSAEHEPALLVPEYDGRRFEPDARETGVFRYRRWLPGTRSLCGAGAGVTYKSEKLGRLAGLSNLWVVFNGYWPEKGATLETTTFKELEAWAVLSRVPEGHEGVLVVASAGNTAAAFARACSMTGTPCLIVVPEAGLADLRFAEEIDPSLVKVVALTGFTDYSDAIALADRVSRLDGFFPEGGIKNLAKREGLGTTMLNAVEAIGELPSFYFQAVGSGAGGIAAHETAKRLVADGRFGGELPRLMLSQNLPFVPIYASWKRGLRALVEINGDDGKRQIRQICAHVLSNRRPAYSVKGGIFDALTESNGDMLAADNLEARHAKRLFEETEGIDIDPAGAVAFATLLKAARHDRIERNAPVLLNITGGGRQRRRDDKELRPVRPVLELDEKGLHLDETPDRVAGLFS